MMRLTWITVFTFLIAVPIGAQQPGGGQQAQAVKQPQANNVPAAAQPARQPFPPLTPEEDARLQKLLLAWEQQSKGTKTLDCSFLRWHYDMAAAPAGVPATKSAGVVKYAAPDQGLFKVDQKVFFNGMKAGKPQFQAIEGKFGEHWVCNGRELIEFDRTMKECRIQALPKQMQGTQIFNSPLPFVFNSDAKQIQERYWVREVAGPAGVYLLEAWPKRQEDRAQYKTVQIALDASTFLPKALMMYAPNFNVKLAQKFDHYEFQEMKRNSLTNGIRSFMNNFIPQKPPANWKIIRQNFLAPANPQPQQVPGQQVPGQQVPVQQAAAPNQPNRQ
jgi:TIGR03009 family protein